LLCQEDLELELVVLGHLLETTTKKGGQFCKEKSAPQTKYWLCSAQKFLSGIMENECINEMHPFVRR